MGLSFNPAPATAGGEAAWFRHQPKEVRHQHTELALITHTPGERSESGVTVLLIALLVSRSA